MPIVDKTFWLIAIAINCANAYIFRSRARAAIERNPELKEGYARLFKGFLVFMNLPWLVMGLGILVGGAQNVFDYFDPRSGNIFVIAFHVTVVVVWMLAVFWIYFGGGAESLVRHPGLMNVDIKSTLVLKVLFAVMLFGGMVAEISMWSVRIP